MCFKFSNSRLHHRNSKGLSPCDSLSPVSHVTGLAALRAADGSGEPSPHDGNRNHPALWFLLLLLATGTACSRKPSSAPNSLADKVVYTDGVGRRVAIVKHPQRIISLAPDVTETLYMLGAQDRLIGVTAQCDWPKEVKDKPKIGDLLHPNYEVILAAKPDLVIASTAGNDQAAVMKLAGLGLPVYVSAPRTVEKILHSVEELGRIIDCADQGGKLVAQMKDRLKKVQDRIEGLPPVRAFFITWFDPLLAPGKNTFETDEVALAGVVSITADIPDFYPRISLEQVLVKDPDAIITVEHQGDPLPNLKRVAGWKDLRAVKEGRVYILGEYLQHPSPLFVDGVEELAQKLHPERFR
jgi:iron complex transport system substrate-binding protein